MKSLNDLIRSVVEQVGDPLLQHIIDACLQFDEVLVRQQVIIMVKRGELRMKGDDVDHAWTYRKGRNWEAYAPSMTKG